MDEGIVNLVLALVTMLILTGVLNYFGYLY